VGRNSILPAFNRIMTIGVCEVAHADRLSGRAAARSTVMEGLNAATRPVASNYIAKAGDSGKPVSDDYRLEL
jgi:hypothetical protein